MIVDAVPLDDARQFTAQYELLRSHVIGAAGDGAQENSALIRAVSASACCCETGCPGGSTRLPP